MTFCNQPVKRRQVLPESNSPGIAGRVATGIRQGELQAGSPTRLAGFQADAQSFPHALKNSTSQPPEESLIFAGGLSNSR